MNRLRVAAVAAVAVLALVPDVARACQACFGADDGPMIDGARAGGWALIALAGFMQFAFATFFLILRRRLRQAAVATGAGNGRGAHS
ncbi:MAG TPA: hypothetical protein VJV75_10480 [Candidatus Polarisedimenticolia bacterium]|nr:hypothetical protein [Candidatus Polarisedimenticolia bacterium]